MALYLVRQLWRQLLPGHLPHHHLDCLDPLRGAEEGVGAREVVSVEPQPVFLTLGFDRANGGGDVAGLNGG